MMDPVAPADRGGSSRTNASHAIETRASFEKIRYANCWEDTDVLLEALDIQHGSRVLSIASGGDNSLALLTTEPEVVVSVDLSAAQIAVTALKALAFRRLEYEEMLAFLGVRESSSANRLMVYRTMRQELEWPSRRFWDTKESLIEEGIVHAGKFERYFRIFGSIVLPLVHSRSKILELMSDKTEAARIRFYDEAWNTWRWRAMFRVFFSRFVMGKAGRDPEFFRYVEGGVAERILERGKHALTTLDPFTNPYLNYIVLGNFGEALPFYLRREHFLAIKENLSALQLIHGSITEVVKHQSFHAFNLSDIFEYMSKPFFMHIADELIRAASGSGVASSAMRPARFAYWNLLNPRSLSDVAPARVLPLHERATELHAKDRSFFYSEFHVDEAIGSRRIV